MNLTAIVLTYNEEKHLARCLESLKGVADAVLVVDCGSADGTQEIAANHGARVVHHRWVNHATQFNWALTQLDASSRWVLRLDADEYLTPVLAAELRDVLPHLADEVDGVYCGRRMTFQGGLMRWGGVFPIRVLRLFRYGRGRCENRWMDEHIKVPGATVDFKGEIIDDNLNSLTWWTSKHNAYASREAVEVLNLKYHFMPNDSIASLTSGEAGLKRWVKESVYTRLPGGVRAFAYFYYRYVLRAGFLDGQAGTAFHVLQGFWYRFLVDAKVAEVERHMARRGRSAVEAIAEILQIDVNAPLSS